MPVQNFWSIWTYLYFKGVKIGKNAFFLHFQWNTLLTALLISCPIYFKFFVQVADKYGYSWGQFQEPSTIVTSVGASDVDKK